MRDIATVRVIGWRFYRGWRLRRSRRYDGQESTSAPSARCWCCSHWQSQFRARCVIHSFSTGQFWMPGADSTSFRSLKGGSDLSCRLRDATLGRHGDRSALEAFMSSFIANRFAIASPAPDIAECELSIVLPCLNEAETVGICVAKAIETLKRLRIFGEVVVVDNGSDDGSGEVARRAGARVVKESRRGYGRA